MNRPLTPIARCREIAGLAPHEIVIGVTPNDEHERLLVKYRAARRSPAVARARLVVDLRAALRRGATGEAADLLIVLRRLLARGMSVGPFRPPPRRSRVIRELPVRSPGTSLHATRETRNDAVILPFAAR